MPHSSNRPWLFLLSELGGVTRYSGGVGHRYSSLLASIAASGVELEALVVADSEVAAAGVGETPFPVVTDTRLLKLHPLLRALPRARIAAQAMRRRTYEYVIAPDWQGMAAYVNCDTKLVTNLVTTLKLADSIIAGKRPFPTRSKPFRAVQYGLERRQLLASRGVIACSNAVLDTTQALFGRLPRPSVVRNSIDVERVIDLAAGSMPAPGFPTGTPTILFTGRLELRKGIDTAVDAFGLVAPLMPQLHFASLGADPEDYWSAYWNSNARSIPPSRLHPLPHSSPANVFASMQAASVCVFPSRWEAFGNVALEAMAAGTPCIVTRGSGFDDFCIDGENCLMVSPGDHEELAAAIMRIIREPHLRARLVATGRETSMRHHVDAVAVDFITAVQNV